jgi:hypothetical protein
MMSNENRSVRRGLLSLSQKGFVPRVNGCGEHIAGANMSINRAMTTRKVLYMLALDMRDAFGSVSHVQLGNNLSKLGLHPMLTGLILDSYTGAQVKVVTLNGVANTISIRRGVKQGCTSHQYSLIFVSTLS